MIKKRGSPVTRKLLPEVRILKYERMYSDGSYIMLSAILPLIFLFKDFRPSDLEFYDSLAIHSVVAGILILFGSFIQTMATKKLNKLYIKKKPKKISIYQQTKQNKKRSTAIKRRK